MVVQFDPVEFTQHVQAVAHARQQLSAHLHRAEIGNPGFPGNTVIEQALRQHAQVEGGVMRHQGAAAHQRLNLSPDFRECRRFSGRLGGNPGQPDIEVGEGCLRIDQRIIIPDDFSVFNDADADGAHSAVFLVGGFHVKDNISRHGPASSLLRFFLLYPVPFEMARKNRPETGCPPPAIPGFRGGFPLAGIRFRRYNSS